MKKWYRNLPLVYKITLMFSLLIVVIILALTSVIRPIFENAMMETATESYMQRFSLVSNACLKILDNSRYLTTILFTNDDMQTWFSQDSIPKQENAIYAKCLQQSMKAEKQLDYLNATWGDNQFSSISAFNKAGDMVNTNNVRNKSWKYFELYNKLKFTNEEQWIDLYALNTKGLPLSGIAYIRPYRDYRTGIITGHILVEYQNDFLSNDFELLQYGKEGNYIVADQDGQVKLTSDHSFTGKNIREEAFFRCILGNESKGQVFDIGNQRYYVTSAYIKTLNWIMIGLIPEQSLTKKGDAITQSVYLIGLLAIIIAASISLFVSHGITRQLTFLAKTMKQFGEGNLKMSVPIHSTDEIGSLSKTFNNMANKIQQLVDQIYREQRDKRKFEFSAMQAQIHPHFLYNTLNSVSSLIKLNKTNDAFKMILAIGTFYRTALSNGNTIIPIMDEILNIKSYIEIQTFRYREKIKYDICIDKEIMQEQIVKFTLQPLVENAIYHGVKLIDGCGLIRIYDKVEDSRIIICVQDNGVGIPAEKISGLLSDNAALGQTSYGLFSVHQRLKLYFGPEYGLQIESVQGVGTTISVFIPRSFGKGQLNEN